MTLAWLFNAVLILYWSLSRTHSIAMSMSSTVLYCTWSTPMVETVKTGSSGANHFHFMCRYSGGPLIIHTRTGFCSPKLGDFELAIVIKSIPPPGWWVVCHFELIPTVVSINFSQSMGSVVTRKPHTTTRPTTLGLWWSSSASTAVQEAFWRCHHTGDISPPVRAIS